MCVNFPELLQFPVALALKKNQIHKVVPFQFAALHQVFISFTAGVHKFAGNLGDTQKFYSPQCGPTSILGGTVQNLVTIPPGAWDVCTPDL